MKTRTTPGGGVILLSLNKEAQSFSSHSGEVAGQHPRPPRAEPAPTAPSAPQAPPLSGTPPRGPHLVLGARGLGSWRLARCRPGHSSGPLSPPLARGSLSLRRLPKPALPSRDPPLRTASWEA